MQINPDPDHHPDDEIRVGLLCPAQGWKGLCRQQACGFSPNGTCSLNGAPHAAFCKIPVSHPVSQQQRAQFVRDPAAPLQ